MLLEHRGDISGVDGDIMSYVSSAEFPPLKHGPSPEAGSSRDKSTLTRKPEEEERHDGIASPPTNLYRSASDINLSSAGDLEQSSFLKAPGMKRVLSETLIARSDNDSQGAEVQEGSDTQQENAVRKSRRRLGRLSIHQPKAAFSKYMVTESASGTEITELPKAHIRTDGNELDSKRKGPSTSLTKLARRSSWILGSRSPSPSNRKTLNGAAKETGKELPLENVDNPGPTSDSVTISPQRKPTSQRSTKSTRRPLSAIIGRSKSAILDENPIPSLPKSLSSDRLPVYTSSTDQVPELPSRDRLQVAPAEAPRKKDELWSHFRSLDAEHQKFLAKPGTLKTNVIRASLLPFLRTYADHPSNLSLRAEDLDRRANILNKWWTGLLEMLNGRNGQSVSGNDRPAVLEGLTGIMVRPEWRLSSSSISSRSDKTRPLRSRSAVSLESSSSDFLAESVLHNVRNIFEQNLLSQMAFVVDRMSMRTVPASVVTFCGKAACYAFFFCPGVAEILVRLWSVSTGTLRRVLDEAGISRNSNLKDIAEQVSKDFPPNLKPLAFKSIPQLTRYLRSNADRSRRIDYIPWYGPWMGRWAGRDSDLFFCFAKYYHVLASECQPESAPKIDRLCAPGALLVYAQMLTVMDGTIHRANSMAPPDPVDGPSPITFDDVLGADASATALPVRPPGTARLMAENRLIMLLRELLSESPTVKKVARDTFAELFSDLLKAATRRTSVHDHNACFTLCDFLEESIAILSRYHRGAADPTSFLDWEFWIKVWKQMGESNNSMTEVRLSAFLYGLWGFITKNEGRRRDICLNWLLQENYMEQQFSHWCPMVRAYYMRLLCWRIARFNGDPSELDYTIYDTLSIRLKKVWCNFLYIQREAERNGWKLPSTAPCNPAPGRRLLIIRDDSVAAPGGVFLSFDGILPSSVSQPSAYERYTSLDNLSKVSTSPKTSPEKPPARSPSPTRKRWTLLRNLNPFSSLSPTPPSSTSPGAGPKMIDSSPSSPASPLSPSKSSITTRNPPSTPAHVSHSFKFSLEWVDRNAPPLRDRRLYPPRLPQPAQAFLISRRPEPTMFEPLKPVGPAGGLSKYCGRALAEWVVLIIECQNFYDRRKAEGVPGVRLMETPMLGVESFRKPTG